jgi:exodeoxyribonuclease V
MGTSILVRGEKITLSGDQDKALSLVMETLRDKGEATLSGAAGTGKTTLIKAGIAVWPGRVMLFAPTGKAALRVAEQTSQRARTLHSGFYGKYEEKEEGSKASLVFGEPKPPEGARAGTLIVVDEASMVTEDLSWVVRTQSRRVGASVLFVGDGEQLPPVGGNPGVQLGSADAQLTQVHRQALDNPVLELATLIRQRQAHKFDRWGESVWRRPDSSIQEAVAWLEEAREGEALVRTLQLAAGGRPKNARVLITWTNRVRMAVNSLVRQGRGYGCQYVAKGEVLLCRYNAHDLGLMNGETIEVESVEICMPLTRLLNTPVQWVQEARYGDYGGRRMLVIPSTFNEPDKAGERRAFRAAWAPIWRKMRPTDGEESAFQAARRAGMKFKEYKQWREVVKKRAVQATWGYCLTAHAAQGSEWPSVGYISCPAFRGYHDRVFRRKLMYTAITRAQSSFGAFVLP